MPVRLLVEFRAGPLAALEIKFGASRTNSTLLSKLNFRLAGEPFEIAVPLVRMHIESLGYPGLFYESDPFGPLAALEIKFGASRTNSTLLSKLNFRLAREPFEIAVPLVRMHIESLGYPGLFYESDPFGPLAALEIYFGASRTTSTLLSKINFRFAREPTEFRRTSSAYAN